MTDDQPWRHELSAEQQQMTDRRLATSLPAGTGVSVLHVSPFWDVVRTREDKFIVTDGSASRKPVKVFGPAARETCEMWARATAEIWRATHVTYAADAWPWEFG